MQVLANTRQNTHCMHCNCQHCISLLPDSTTAASAEQHFTHAFYIHWKVLPHVKYELTHKTVLESSAAKVLKDKDGC